MTATRYTRGTIIKAKLESRDLDFCEEKNLILPGGFPFGVDFGFELAAADEFLQVADDGAAGDAVLAG